MAAGMTRSRGQGAIMVLVLPLLLFSLTAATVATATTTIMTSSTAAAATILPSALAQKQDSIAPYNILKTDKVERFTLPYQVSNLEFEDRAVYVYDEPKQPNWIMGIVNNMTYSARDDARTVFRISEPAPGGKFVEIAMHGGEARKFWVAINTPEGYARLYSKDTNGWSTDQPIAVTHAENQGLTVTDGKRIVIDRFKIDGGFAAGSISVYGKDETSAPINAYAGEMTFDVLYGSPADSPLYFVPLGVMLGVGGLMAGLLVLKKRRSPSPSSSLKK